MPSLDARARRVRISLYLSVAAGVVAVGYFAATDRPVLGVGLGVLLVVAGAWEYKQKMADVRAERRREADAERQEERRRG